MTEQTPDQLPEDPAGDDTPAPAPDPTPEAGGTYTVPEYKPTAPTGNKGSGRFAVYDMTLERYVSEVSDSKPSSADAKKLAGDHSYRIIEV